MSNDSEPLPEDRLDTMREKAHELLDSDGLESFTLTTVDGDDLSTVVGSQLEQEYPDYLMSLHGLASAISVMTKRDPRMDAMEPWDVAQWAFHFRHEHAEMTGEDQVHPISGKWDTEDDSDDSDSDPDVMTDGGQSMGDTERSEGERHWECRHCGRRITVWGEPLSKCLNCREMDWKEIGPPTTDTAQGGEQP